MAIFKNKDIETNINERTVELGNINANFYTEDEQTASIRMFIKWNNHPVNLKKINMKPVLSLFMQDGSIFEGEKVEVVIPEKGIIQYKIPSNVIKHIGKVNAKLLLENENESIHVANFNFTIVDSGTEEPVRKELSFNLVDEAIRRIVQISAMELLGDGFEERLNTDVINHLDSNPELFKGEKGEIGNTDKLITRNVVSSGENSPLITFVDDDGRTEVLEKWEPILQEKGNKLTIPLITQWMDDPNNTSVITWEDVHRLKEQYGVEFVSHTHEHKHAQQITDEEVEKELKLSHDVLKREGLTYNIIVQPFGENTKAVRKISRKYYRANVGTKENTNTIPLDTFNVKRISLGEDLYTTFDAYKEKIDQAIANNGWIIFKSHSQYESFDENQLQLIRQIIDYAREQQMLEVNLEEGFDYMGNLIDAGDYFEKAKGTDYFVMDRNGKIYSNFGEKNYYTLKYNSVNINTPITDFEDLTTSTLPIISSNAQGFPNNTSGQLVTTKSESLGLSYQLYMINNSNDIYKRRWNTTTNNWTKFEKIAGSGAGDTNSPTSDKNYDMLKYNTVSINTPITNFADKTTSTVAIVSSNAQGFPNNDSGQLVTTKSESLSLSYQLYLPNNSNVIYKRRWNTTTNTWTPFEPITPITKEVLTRQYANNTLLEPQTTSDVIITNSVLDGMNFDVGDTITATTETALPSGIMYNVFITEKNKITVRYSNITTEEISIPATYFNFRITYK